MDAGTWLRENADLRTPEGEFACREGCGFCCTYPPKVSRERLEAIEAARGPASTFTDERGNRRLALQGGCGGCTLLEDRDCQAHEHRPDHCRFFPFHVYFGREVEVLADRVCPGVAPEQAPAGPHEPAREADAWGAPRPVDEAALSSLRPADPDELERRARRVREEHERVRAEARWADRWREPGEAVREARPHVSVTPRAWSHALGPFGADDPAQLPTAVLPDGDGFPWRAWRIRDGRLTRLAFTETGGMRTLDTRPAPSPPTGSRLAEPVEAVLDELVGLEAFAGTVFHLVDQAEASVDEAVERRLADVAAGLSLHARLLEAEGLPATTAWLRAVYEPEFYTLETLGEWL